MRKLRSPLQAAPKCVRWRALCLHNLPDETTKQEEETPLRLGCRTQALAPFCHCRHVTWITLSTTRNKAIGTVQSLRQALGPWVMTLQHILRDTLAWVLQAR